MQPPGQGSPPGHGGPFGPPGPIQSGQGQYPQAQQALGQPAYGSQPQQPAYGTPQQQPSAPAQQAYPQPGSPPAMGGAFGQPASPPQQPYGAPSGQAFGAPAAPPQGAPSGQAFAPAGPGPGTLNPALVARPAGPVGPGPFKTDHVKPRISGLSLVGVGFLLLGLNAYTLWSSEEFYPKALFFAFPLLMIGGWLTVVGKPVDSHTGQPVLWSSIGAGAFGAIGVIVSIAAIWFIGC